jgi:hypothetical protein
MCSDVGLIPRGSQRLGYCRQHARASFDIARGVASTAGGKGCAKHLEERRGMRQQRGACGGHDAAQERAANSYAVAAGGGNGSIEH